MKDAEHRRFVRFNKAGEELLGFSREQVLGKSDYDLFRQEEADFFKEQRQYRSSERSQLLDINEEPVQTRYKGRRWLHTKKVPILADDGRPQYLLGNFRGYNRPQTGGSDAAASERDRRQHGGRSDRHQGERRNHRLCQSDV